MRGLNLRTVERREQVALRIAKPNPCLKPSPDRNYGHLDALKGVNDQTARESVPRLPIRRMYYYCKKARIWNTAYNAVEGKKSYHVKFGLHIANADPRKWQEQLGHIRQMVEEAEQEQGTKASFDYKINCGILEITAHVSEHFWSAWNETCRSDSESGHHHGSHHAGDVSSAPESSHASHGAHPHNSHQDGAEHYSHSGSHHHETHHASDHEYSGWFFQSTLNMAGLNPYAICIANYKAGSVHAEKAHHGQSHSHAHNGNSHGAQPHGPGYQFSPAGGAAAQDYSGCEMSIPAAAPGSGAHAKERNEKSAAHGTRVHVSRANPAHSLHALVPVRRANPVLEAGARGRESAHGGPVHAATASANPKQATGPREIYHIASRAPLKITPKLVVGAEALPE